VVLELGGTRYGCAVQRVDDRVYVDSALESSAFTIVDPFPPVEADRAGGSLTSPLPGVVVAVSASVGEHVAAGEPLVVLEAMKMEHTVVAPHDGTVVEVKVAVGEQVETGAVLVVLDADAGVTA
jgi:biotin carboxyl carrier protein